MELLQILLLALVPTIAIELGVLLFVRERRRKVLLASVVMNILTNIPLNFLMICLEGDDIVLFTAEAVVIVLEALGYMLVVRQIGPTQPTPYFKLTVSKCSTWT